LVQEKMKNYMQSSNIIKSGAPTVGAKNNLLLPNKVRAERFTRTYAWKVATREVNDRPVPVA